MGKESSLGVKEFFNLLFLVLKARHTATKESIICFRLVLVVVTQVK